METLRVHVGEMPRMARDITTRALQNLGSAVLDAPRDPTAVRPAGNGHPPILIVAAHGERLGSVEAIAAAVSTASSWDERFRD